MPKRMLIDAQHKEEMRVAIADHNRLLEFDYTTISRKQLKGNIYLAKITRVEPSLQACFVEYGGGKQGFLPFSEIHPDYYQIPVADRKRLIEEVEREAALEDGEAVDHLPEEQQAQPAETSGEDAPAELPELGEMPAFDAAPAEFDEAMDEPLPLAPALEFEIKADEPAEEPIVAAPQETTIDAVETVETPQDIETIEEAPAAEEGANAMAESATDTVVSAPAEEGDAPAANAQPQQQRRRYVPFFKRYKIQEVIKRNQIVLVQVIKEERGNKGVSLTTYLSLAGRYCVLMPNSPRDGGVSRKISDGETRRRLKDVMAELKLARGMSVIIRTAGIDRTRAEIRRDFDYLVKVWNQVRDKTLESTAPALVYEESDLIKRAVRDQYTNDMEEVLVEGDEAFESAKEFMNLLLPSHTPRVKQYKGEMPLFYAYGVEDQLLSMYDPVVKLRSGGYIVISPTEALISIDVNSGRATTERNIEETAAKTNLEAAAEVARQLRLRDLAGLIVIDFIDMMEGRNRRNVERALRDALKTDRAKIQLGRISPFGLLEMSRQRLRPSISESSMVPCAHCAGKGVVRSQESLSLQIIRTLEKEASSGAQTLRLLATEETALFLLNHKRKLISDIETRYSVTIQVVIDHSLSGANFAIDKQRSGSNNNQQRGDGEQRRGRRGGRGRERDRDRELQDAPEASNDSAPSDDAESSVEGGDIEIMEGDARTERPGGRGRRGGRRRRGGRGRDRERFQNNDGSAPQEISAEGAETSTDAPVEGAEASNDNQDGNRPRRGNRERGNRGGRGRRRWREGEEGNPNAVPQGDAPGAPTPRQEQGESLPAFTRQAVIQEMPIKQAEPALVHATPATERPEGQPARKGWWQKIIELD